MTQLQDYQIREILSICTHQRDGEVWGADISLGSLSDLILRARLKVSEYEDEFEHIYDAYLGDDNEGYTFEEFVDICENDPEFKSEFDK